MFYFISTPSFPPHLELFVQMNKPTVVEGEEGTRVQRIEEWGREDGKMEQKQE